jgi:hypothetical protein
MICRGVVVPIQKGNGFLGPPLLDCRGAFSSNNKKGRRQGQIAAPLGGGQTLESGHLREGSEYQNNRYAWKPLDSSAMLAIRLGYGYNLANGDRLLIVLINA